MNANFTVVLITDLEFHLGSDSQSWLHIGLIWKLKNPGSWGMVPIP